MSFSIRLGADVVSAEAGATTPVALIIENKGAGREQFEIEVEGIDSEWKAIPVPVVACGPNESCSERFFLKPPRASESVSGNYPFVVRVRSLESGEVRTAQGVLDVRPFHHLSMEISPKRGVVTPFSQQNLFEVSMVNLGNVEHTVRLQGNDPEDALAFEFEQEQVSVGPGQQRTVEAVAVPATNRLVSSGRLIGFTVTGRSVDVPNVVATSQAQLEQRSLFSPASLTGVLLLLLLGFLWFINMPRPPGVARFEIDPDQVEMGQNVLLKWSAPEASIVKITADGMPVTEESARQGEFQFTTPVSLDKDRIVFELIAEKGGLKSEPAKATLLLTRPEVVPDPKIESLSVTDRSVKLGDPFILSYKFSDSVVRAVVSPDNVTLDPALPSISISPRSAGRLTYTVTAYNKANKTVAKTFTVSVVDVSEAKILSFSASPKSVKEEDGRTTLTWSVMNAARIQVKANGDALNIDETQMSGGVDISIKGKTSFTLTAYDEKGRPTAQTQVVEFVKTPVDPGPDIPPEIPGETGGTTSGENPPPPTTSGGTTTGR